MDTKATRRTVLRTAVWTAPAVTIAVAAPAFATSDIPKCTGLGWYKAPGKGKNTKDYYVQLDCGYISVTSVSIYDNVDKVWREAELVAGKLWVAKGFNDSRRNRQVMINGSQTITVSFPPSK